MAYTTRRTNAPRHTPTGPAKNPSLTCPTCKKVGALTTYEAIKNYNCANCTRAAEFGV